MSEISERGVECGVDGEYVLVPRAIAEEWGERVVKIESEVNAAIDGAIGVDDGLLGDLIETLDLVARHFEWNRAVSAPSISVTPSAFRREASTN